MRFSQPFAVCGPVESPLEIIARDRRELLLYNTGIASYRDCFIGHMKNSKDSVSDVDHEFVSTQNAKLGRGCPLNLAKL